MGKERESANLVSTLTGIAVTISGDPVVLGIGSTEHLRLHDDGRIGFGTNSAIAKLDIRGGVTQDGGEECLMVASSDPQNIPSTITTGYSYGTLQVFGGGMSGSSRRGGQIDFIGGSDLVTGIDTGALLFRTGLTTAGGTSQPERVRISAAGLVGIATTSNLTAKLTVGNIENSSVTDKGATAFKTLNSSGGVGESAIYIEEQSGSEGWYLKVNSSGDLQFNDSGVSDRITFQDGGNIGIGTDNPVLGTLHINQGSNGFALNLQEGSSANPKILFTNTAGNAGGTVIEGDPDTSSGFLAFTAGNSERVRITGAGLLGIGTDDPSAPISIKVGPDGEYVQDFRGTADKQFGFFYDQSSWNQATFRIDEFNSNGTATSRLSIYNGGNIGIGITNPDSFLTVASSGASAQIEIKRTNTNTTGAIGALNFTALDGHSVANIFAVADGDDEGAHLVFKTTTAAAENSPYGSGTLERLRITSAGRLGIGTDNPNSFLHVHGDNANTLFRLKRTDASAQILNDFGSGDSALKYTVNDASSYILGVDDSDADRFKLSYGSSDDAAFGTNDLVSVTTAGNLEVDSGDLTLNGNLVGAINVTVADDAFASITPPREGGGWVFLTTRGQGSTYPWSTGYGFSYLDWGASAQVSANTEGGSVDFLSSGPPNGTTGADEKVTIFVGGTAGTLYVENRLGATYSFQLTFI